MSMYLNFSQLGNSAFSVKGKVLINVKIYVEIKNFFKKKNLITRQATKYQMSVMQ